MGSIIVTATGLVFVAPLAAVPASIGPIPNAGDGSELIKRSD